ncbi:hypothetical protein LCGC14_3018400 [marine sediment metagenome]|uniref:Uncharacterized protein n=1 Tax=marine sediment metagenome TaxID=412755 RepID=A0A0F8WW03_9ZZZZ
MAISGTIPHFSLGPINPTEGVVVVTVTGVTADGQSTATFSTEGQVEFLKRIQVTLGGISGVELVSGVSGQVNGVTITSAQLSGILQIQREVAMRSADITHSFEANGPRLIEARRVLALSGGEIKGLA